MFYGVWVNVNDDVFLGVPIGSLENVEKELLALAGKGYQPCDGDNLLVFTEGGVLFATFDVDNQEWQAE